MKCRPKSIPLQNKDSHKVSYGHLSFIFFIMFILISSPITVLAVGFSNYRFFWIGPVIGSIVAYFIARENYHSMLSLGLKKYNEKYRDNVCCCNKTYPYTEDSGSPLDPASNAYWTTGPGLGNNQN